MADSIASPSLDDLLEFIRDDVSREFQETGRSVTGAKLAEAIRARFPDLDIAGLAAPELGIQRLGDLVRVAQSRGLVARRNDVQHLEVLPLEPPIVSKSFPSRLSPPPSVGRIRREIWQALVFYHPGEACFIDRQTGEVICVPVAEAPSYKGTPRYVALDTIPADIQKKWMREFVSSNPVPTQVAGAIEAERWYTAFPSELRAYQPALAVAWGSTRARQVVAYVRHWAAEHGIAFGELLVSSAGVASHTDLIGAPETNVPPVQQGKNGEGEAVRKAVLAVLRDMSLEELLSLSLPLRHLVRHFKPR